MEIYYCMWLLIVVLVSAKHDGYAGWKSYYVTPSSSEQQAILGKMEEILDLDFLSHAGIDREGLVLVKPEYQEKFKDIMEKEGISYEAHAEDVKTQLDIDDQRIQARRNVNNRYSPQAELPYEDYQTLDVIYDYLDSIAEKYPDIVTLVTPANSFEGRPIKYLKISSSNFQNSSKSVVFIEATTHPREWITVPVATYAIHKLVENLTDPELLEQFDWIVLPMVNPDGYVHTFEEARFWRKNLSVNKDLGGRRCPGVDINRNYDFVWNTIGVSNDPCAETYPGSEAASEVETRVVRDILHGNLDRIVLFLSMHSYGSMILYSWGHDGTLSKYGLVLQEVGVKMAEAITKKSLSHFPKYVVGNSQLVVGYPASGASQDYAHSIGVPLAYTIELPGLSRGMMGFHLEPEYVRQVVEETWEGIAVGAKRARELFGK